MTEATLSITNPDEILALFVPRDQHLRKLRRLFDVSITNRDGRIRISGEGDDVERATRTLEKLRRLSRKQGELTAGDIDNAASEEGVVVDGGSPQLAVASAWVDEGPSYKRLLARARGRAAIIKHRSCHISIVLDDGQN